MVSEKEELNIIKIVGLALIFIITMIFGCIPNWIQSFTNPTILSFANAFSGGLFLGIGLFHLLPDANKQIEQYYHDKEEERQRANHKAGKGEAPYPFAFVVVFITYSIMLLLEKVLFRGVEEEKNESIYNQKLGEIEEEEKKEVNDINGPMLNENETKQEKANSINEDGEEENKQGKNVVSFGVEKKSDKPNFATAINSYIIMVALSCHGIFESLAFGLNSDKNSTIALLVAFIVHKWAEALTLGIAFLNAKLNKLPYYVLMTIFCLFGPIGGAIGMILVEANVPDNIQGILISISVGTFLYISCSEVISEEFDKREHRWLKFILYIVGGALAFLIIVIENLLPGEDEEHEEKE